MKFAGKRVLSFGAHPDDIEFGCGGTERILIEQGCEVTHAYLTSGGAGSNAVPHDELCLIREKEARTAAQVLGAHRVEFFHCQDGLTNITREVVVRLISLIRATKPHIVFTHASSDKFSDHKIVGDAVRHAIHAAAGPWYYEALEREPWKVDAVYGYEVWDPLPSYALAVDIGKTLEVKEKALREHKSQVATIDYVAACRGLATYRGVMSGRGAKVEVFEVILNEAHTLKL